MARAASAGYDQRLELPRLASTAGGLDRQSPTWDLYARLLEDCESALTPDYGTVLTSSPSADTLAESAREVDNLAMHHPERPDDGFDSGAR